MKTKGCVVSQNVKRELSSEAKPFIPLSAIAYFDKPVKTFKNSEMFFLFFVAFFCKL